MIMRRDMLVVEVLRKGGMSPPVVNQEAGRVGGAGQVNKYITISDRA